jgi:hypothetical protein
MVEKIYLDLVRVNIVDIATDAGIVGIVVAVEIGIAVDIADIAVGQ